MPLTMGLELTAHLSGHKRFKPGDLLTVLCDAAAFSNVWTMDVALHDIKNMTLLVISQTSGAYDSDYVFGVIGGTCAYVHSSALKKMK
jgi:hypothetical protein